MSQKLAILVDGNSLIHRAYHALPPLTSPDGELVGALYGFTSMFLKALEQIKPTHAAIAWDTKEPTFRHKEYEEYKAHREETPKDLVTQIKKAQELGEVFNIPQVSEEGYEADDVIGTLADKLFRQGLEVVIVTGDLDALQLVNDKVKVFTTKKGISETVVYDVPAVKERFEGLTPEQVVDYKALKGDSSDNIPGVRGVGDKTAKKLLTQYPSLEEIYQHLGEVALHHRKKLQKDKENAFLSKKLAKIDSQVPIDFAVNKMRVVSYDPQKVLEQFRKYGFKSLIKRLPRSEKMTQASILPETKQLTQKNTEFSENEFDPQIAAHLLTGQTGSRLSWERLVFTYLGKQVEFEKLDAREKNRLKHQLREVLESELDEEKNSKIKELFYKLEMPLKKVLRKMERQGVLVDLGLLKTKRSQLVKQIARVEEGIFQQVGEEFNLNSPKQLGEVLFDKLELPVVKRTKTQRSTDESVLRKLKPMHPVVEKVLEYRKLSKLKSTYLDPLPDLLDDENRVHTHYRQTRAASGRLSSESPNLQNIPKGKRMGLRRLFVSPPGQRLVKVDYSQFELRLMAHITDDRRLIDSFKSGQDIHAATAARLFNKLISEVNPEERKVGKTTNFALMYGMTPHGLSEQLGIGQARAKNYIERFFKNYPGVEKWRDKHLEEVREKGYVETIFGRRRPLPALNSGNYHQRATAERVAVNHPLQGTQADLIKMAMLKIDKRLSAEFPKVRMILQVHDELVFEVPKEEVEKFTGWVRSYMEGVYELKVPIVVDIEVGKNWGETGA